MLQLAMAITEKETDTCRGTAEAIASPGTSDEWTKVPEDQRSAIDLLRLVDPWAKTTDGKGIKTCVVESDTGTFSERGKGPGGSYQWFFEHNGYYGQPSHGSTGAGKGQGWAHDKGALWSRIP